MPVTATPYLLDLPLAVLSQLVSFSSDQRTYSRRHHPLLRVCRSGRDAVLLNARQARLYPADSSTANTRPLSRLLQRVCTSHQCSVPFLVLELDGSLLEGREQDLVLAQLLQPATVNGWSSVDSLTLTSWAAGPASGHLVGPSFPALRKLVLWHVCLLHGGLLAGLLCCPQLTSLQLHHCSLEPTAVAGAAALLSRLPCLQELTCAGPTPLALAVSQTRLTSLALTWRFEPVDQLLSVAEGLPLLERLSLEGNGHCSASQLQRLFAACSRLVALNLNHHIDQEGLDVLLSSGSNLTRLEMGKVSPTRDRSEAVCSWRQVGWVWSDDLRPWAYLPLGAVHQLTVYWPDGEDIRLPDQNELWLPVSLCALSDSHDADLPHFLHLAAANLAACPAWQAAGPAVKLGLYTSDRPSFRTASGLGDSLRLQVLEALKPLSSQVQQLSIDMLGFKMGRAEVAALGRACGSHISSLTFQACYLQRDFWPALWSQLPSLTRLEIGGWHSSAVSGQISESDLAMFCSHAIRPFTLVLSGALYDEVRGDSLQDCCQLWGTSHTVSVVRGL